MAVSEYSGKCSVCGKAAEFIDVSGPVREGWRCNQCGASTRYRCQAAALLSCLPKYQGGVSLAELAESGFLSEYKIFEPGITGPFRTRLSKAAKLYQNSYYFPEHPMGSEIKGVRNEDLEALTFENESFDIVITSDIFEHVRHPMNSFREAARILKPGGVHIFTVPAQLPIRRRTQFRVNTTTNEDVHILPPHYHVAGDGGKSLVYTEFGIDFFEEVHEKIGTKISHFKYVPESGHCPSSVRNVVAFIQAK